MLPEPMTPPDADVRSTEPPWEAFVDLAVQQYGLSHHDAQNLVDSVRVKQGPVQ